MSSETHRFTVVPELLSLTDKELLVSETVTPAQIWMINVTNIHSRILNFELHTNVGCVHVLPYSTVAKEKFHPVSSRAY